MSKLSSGFFLAGVVLLAGVPVSLSDVVNVNYGYFKEPAGHLWTYAIDAHTWTDPETNTTYKYTYWPQTSGGKVIEKLQNGELDIAHLGNAPWGSGATRGIPGKMVYVIHSKDKSQTMVTRQGINTPMDLKGKKLAYIAGSTTHYMLEGFLEQTALSLSDFAWVGHMGAADQKLAWDKGEIDAGYMWGGNMRHLQNNIWCSTPDPGTTCAEEGVNQTGYDLFTAGISKRWGKETWNNLVVSDAFAAAHPNTVYRSVKVVSLGDTKLVQDKGWYSNDDVKVCGLSVATQMFDCDADDLQTIRNALSYDVWLDYETQQSSDYMGEKKKGECATETIGSHPNNDGACTRDTMAGSAWSTWATAEFGYKLKNFPYLPSYAYYQSTMDSTYIDAVGTSDDKFPNLTVDDLAELSHYSLVSPNTSNHCGDQPHPIMLSSPGVFKDHDGTGFYDEGASCYWQIDQAAAVYISDIDVRIERDQDNVYIYEGLCNETTCGDFPLLAKFTGGKGTSSLTLHDLGQRPPVLVPSGQATVVFQPDGTADRPLAVVVNDGLSMTWALAPSGSCQEPCLNGGTCSDGVCQCVDGWAGADCSYSSCLGTSQLSAEEAAQTIVHGADSQTGHNAHCTWVITADSDKVIFFEFVKLDLDWLFDPLEFYDGDALTGTKLGRFSGYLPAKLNASVGERCPGDMCPLALYSTGATATVRWTSDAMQSGEGFELKYRAVALAEVLCGTGATASCTGHGTCGGSGCQCDEGWFGQFCQVQQCVGQAADLTAANGTIINMAASQPAYAPARSCSWLVKPPALGPNETVGAVAFRVKRFDMEAASTSGDSLVLGEGDGSFTLSGMAPPCSEDISGCASDADCHGGICESSGACTCSDILVAGSEVLVQFVTDNNDYPPGSAHAGFEIEFTAVYQCTRGASGACLTPSPCTPGSVPKTVGGVEICDPCPAGQYQTFDPASELPTCTHCSEGTYTDKKMQTECTLCDPGSYCPFAADQMLPCQAGTYAGAAGTAQCAPCPVGSYTNMTWATGCDSCSTGRSNPDLYATQSQVLVSGAYEWVPSTGAESAAACGCKKGAYEREGECETCGEGMECAGMGEVTILADYFATADEPGFVWRCYGTDYRRCPGGPPGTCAEKRLASSVACTTCEDGMVPSDQGECKDCSGVHVLPIVFLLIGALALMLILYRILGSSDPAARSKSILLVATVSGQLFTFVQQLGIMGAISMEWKSPFAEFLVTISLFNFKLDYLSLECATSVDPVSKFTGRVFLVIAFVLSMLMIHAISVVIHHKGAFKERNPALICSVGTVFSTFFMSIMASMLAPFQCAGHPNGLQTVRDYPSVVCYDSAFGDDHAIMLGVSAAGALIPLAFFASVVYVVLQMEKRLAAGDERFLRSFLFLFFRFRTGAHTYIAVFLLRNLIVAVVPALGSTMFQIAILQVIMLPLLVVTVYFMPWNAFLANVIDGSSTMFLCLIVTLFAFYCEDVDPTIVAQLCTAICCVAFLVIFCAIAWGVSAHVLRGEKPMRFFLCHHKAGAGNFARLLKMSLDKKSKKKTGVDSDYVDPSALFATVVSDVDTLLVVCSKQITSQLFCVGEMTTANLNKVPVCNVILPGFEYPSEDFVQKYERHVPDVANLARYGLNLELVKAALPNSGQEFVELPSQINGKTMQSLVGMLMREQETVALQDEKGTIDPSGSSSLFIVSDMGALECSCAALVLQLLLESITQGKAKDVPQLLPLGATLPKSAKKVCLVLSNGMFTSPHVVDALKRAVDVNAALLPVIAEPSFRFPTKGSLQQLADDGGSVLAGCTGADLARLVGRVFERTLVEMNPQAPDADLFVRAQSVAAWFSDGRPAGADGQPDVHVQPDDPPELEDSQEHVEPDGMNNVELSATV